MANRPRPLLDARDTRIVRYRRRAARKAHMQRRKLYHPEPEMLTELQRWKDLPLQLWRCARLMACGYTAAAIARRIKVTTKTAGVYRVRVLRRMGVPSQTMLARKAIRDGFVKPDESWDAKGAEGRQRNGPAPRLTIIEE